MIQENILGHTNLMETFTKVQNLNPITRKGNFKDSNQGNQASSKMKVSKHKVFNNNEIPNIENQIKFLPTHDLNHQVKQTWNYYTNLAVQARDQGLDQPLMREFPHKDILGEIQLLLKLLKWIHGTIFKLLWIYYEKYWITTLKLKDMIKIDDSPLPSLYHPTYAIT